MHSRVTTQSQKQHTTPSNIPRCADAGRRAVNVWLREHTDQALAEQLRAACVTLHGPTRTGDYQYSSAQLRTAVLHNFRSSARWIREAPQEHKALVQNALAARCAALRAAVHQRA